MGKIYLLTNCFSPIENADYSLVMTGIVERLKNVAEKIMDLANALNRPVPRLVAVSKTFPSEPHILACYEAGQRHFGENYIDELSEKAESLRYKAPDIKWHFIGTLQSNKIKKLCEVPGLWCIETLSKPKHASLLQTILSSKNVRLNVFIQVNTSNEGQKGGIQPEDANELAMHITSNCPNLELLGLMTIGSLTESTSEENSDFLLLARLRDKLSAELAGKTLELSIGMSTDYEQ